MPILFSNQKLSSNQYVSSTSFKRKTYLKQVCFLYVFITSAKLNGTNIFFSFRICFNIIKQLIKYLIK